MRVEYKYFISHGKMLELVDYFDMMFERDHHYQHRPYGVSSVYYDTRGFDFYHEKIEGEYFHRKARLRTYGDRPLQGPSYFESKYKFHDDGFKHRIKITGSEYERLSLLDLGFAMQSYDEQMQKILGQDLIFPVCCVHYKRRAYFLTCGGVTIRLNVDSEMVVYAEQAKSREEEHDEQQEPQESAEYRDELFPHGDAIVEVKLPDRCCYPHVAEILKAVGSPRTTFSKYVSAVNVLYSQLRMETPNEF